MEQARGAQALNMGGDISDERLMLLYRDGDAEAFEQLYRRHKDALYGYLFRQCSNPAIAIELAQDVWLNVIRARRRYRPKAKFSTYLFKLARNRLIDHFRKHSGTRSNPSDGEDTPDVEELADEANPGPERQASAEVDIERLSELIETLPDLQREAFLLFAEGLSVPEIAEVTDTQPETARSRLRYALGKLRAAFASNPA